MQGRCSATPGESLEITGTPLREVLPGQCVLVTDRPLLAQYFGRLWLDNIYIRLQPSKTTPAVLRAAESASDNGAEMWVTRTTIQGDGSVAEGLDGAEPQALMGIHSRSLVYAHGAFLSSCGDARHGTACAPTSTEVSRFCAQVRNCCGGTASDRVSFICMRCGGACPDTVEYIAGCQMTQISEPAHMDH